MNNYVTGAAIRALRERRGYTQKQLAQAVMVGDKAVSKWETGRGLPDITLLEPLASALGVSVAELMSGEPMENRNRHANLLKSVFYVCPVCGNILHATGGGSFSCCGVSLPALEPEAPEGEHALRVERVEYEHYVTLDHPMRREHFISFLAYVTTDRLQLVKLYPEQDAAARFPIVGDGLLYAYCNRHGLFAQKI